MPKGQYSPTSKYDASFVQRLIDFFDIEPWYESQIVKRNKNGDVMQMKEERPNKLPMFGSFAREIGVTHQTLMSWARIQDENGNLLYPDFAEAYKDAKEMQKNFLIQNALRGLYNPTAFIFTAKNVSDMRDVAVVETVQRQLVLDGADSKG